MEQMRVVVLSLLFGISLTANVARSDDWPHWRGPNRDGIVAESSRWDEGRWPPKEAVWSANVGIGSTSPLVVDGRLYTMGWRDGSDTVVCLDAVNGKEIWHGSYRCPRYGRHAAGDQKLYAGPTSTPEYDSDTACLYTLSVDGDLNCWDTRQKGRKVWGLSLYETYGMPQRPKVGTSGTRDYGYTTAPHLYGEWLIVEVGGKGGNLVAFSKRTGERVWSSESTDFAGHTGGPVLMAVEGVPCVAVLTHTNLLVARLDAGNEGKTVAECPWSTHFANTIASPAIHGSDVLITSGYNHMTMCKVRVTLQGAEEVWKQRYVSKVCTPIIHDGRVYWAWRKVHCLDLATGELRWQGAYTADAGSCILTSDRRLIVWAKNGDLLLVETAERSPDKYKQLARTAGIFRTHAWPHVVLADGRLYCKDRSGNLKCFSLRNDDQKVAPRVVAEEKPVTLKSWPGDAPGLVLAWQRGSDAAELGLKVRGAARIDQDGYLELTNGAFLAPNADTRLLNACKQSNELTIETVLMAHSVKQGGPARIISFSADPYRRNFTLGQERARLVLRLRTPHTGPNGMKPEMRLCSVKPGQFHHVIVTYRDGQLACYLDGKPILEDSAVQGDLSNWEPMHLLFGDEWQGRRDWSGQLERVAIHNRFIGPKEARQRCDLWRTNAER